MFYLFRLNRLEGSNLIEILEKEDNSDSQTIIVGSFVSFNRCIIIVNDHRLFVDSRLDSLLHCVQFDRAHSFHSRREVVQRRMLDSTRSSFIFKKKT